MLCTYVLSGHHCIILHKLVLLDQGTVTALFFIRIKQNSARETELT